MQIVISCCGIAPRSTGENNPEGKNQTIELKNVTTLILKQNSPNPFEEETDINYELPEEVKTAVLMIYDKTGHVLQKVKLNERGKGNIHIYAPDLSSGAYTYSLIADGKVIDTKTMVKTQ